MKYFVIPLGLIVGFFLAFTYSAYAFTGTLTDVTASRALNTSYQNTGDNDIIVYLSSDDIGGGFDSKCQLSTDNSTWVTFQQEYQRNESGRYGHALTCVVPPDYYYRFQVDNVAGDAPTLVKWWEYETPIMSGGGGSSTISTDPILNALVATFLVLYTAQYVRRLFYS